MNAERWHMRAVRLPDGTQPEEWWIVDGRVSDQPIAGARELPGGWFLPGGLVDAHAHLTMNFNSFPLPDGGDELIAANLAAQRRAGVLAVRDAGLAWGGQPARADLRHGPRLQSAGRLLAAPGRGYPQVCAHVPAEGLVDAALEDIRAGAAWVKILADFPGPDGDWFAAPPSYPLETLEAVVRAAHAAGVRVMAHSTGRAASDLVRAGVDSIEHGMVLSGDLLEPMADRGIAWSLTIGTALMHVGPFAALDSPVGAYIRGALDRVRELLPLAASLGVPLLAGTDELPHGAIARELAALLEFGLTPAQAIAAASTGARAYLGLPAFGPGAPGDLVTFAADPRADLAALARPAAVVFNGQRLDTD